MSTLMDFEASWKSKNGLFACEGLQKSRFRINEYLMLIRSDFGLIFGRSGHHFGKKIDQKSIYTMTSISDSLQIAYRSENEAAGRPQGRVRPGLA